MRFLREISDRDAGIELPLYLGFAYRLSHLRASVYALVPFNYLIGWSHRWYYRLIGGPRDRYSKAIDLEVSESFRRGYKLGEMDGRQNQKLHDEDVLREFRELARVSMNDYT